MRFESDHSHIERIREWKTTRNPEQFREGLTR